MASFSDNPKRRKESEEINPPAVYSLLMKQVAKTDNFPNEAAVLFHCVAETLKNLYNCRQFKTEVKGPWSCSVDYNGEVFKFIYFQRVFELSVLTEVTEGSTIEYYYIVFNFPNDKKKPIYHVERCVRSRIPSLKAENEVEDSGCVEDIIVQVGRVTDKFFCKVVENGFVNREFSVRGVNPMLPKKDPPTKKGRRNVPKIANAPALTTPSASLYADLLKQCNKSKPVTDSSKLFGTIHTIMSYTCSVKPSQSIGIWPGGPAYNNEALCVCLRGGQSLSFAGEKKSECKLFYIAVLKNKNEFFLSMRSFDVETKFIIRKIVSALVPSFIKKDKELDEARIMNLVQLFANAIRDKFINPVMKGSFLTPTLSLLSVASGTSFTDSEQFEDNSEAVLNDDEVASNQIIDDDSATTLSQQ